MLHGKHKKYCVPCSMGTRISVLATPLEKYADLCPSRGRSIICLFLENGARLGQESSYFSRTVRQGAQFSSSEARIAIIHYDYRSFEGLKSILRISKCVFQQFGAFGVKINREIVDFWFFRLGRYRDFRGHGSTTKGKKSRNPYY